MKTLFIKLITFYQAVLSPDHSFWAKTRFPHGYCRFYPSCSQYAKEAILRYGVLRGTARAILRILRCNPFSSGGYEPAGFKENS